VEALQAARADVAPYTIAATVVHWNAQELALGGSGDMHDTAIVASDTCGALVLVHASGVSMKTSTSTWTIHFDFASTSMTCSKLSGS
jgi:hypothetical protein